MKGICKRFNPPRILDLVDHTLHPPPFFTVDLVIHGLQEDLQAPRAKNIVFVNDRDDVSILREDELCVVVEVELDLVSIVQWFHHWASRATLHGHQRDNWDEVKMG